MAQENGKTASLKALYALALIILAAVLVRILVFSGLGGSDDLVYGRAAYDISKGDFTPTNYGFHGRYAIFVPAALFFRVLGVSETVSIIYPFVCSILSIVLVFLAAKRLFSEEAGLYAAAFLAFLPLNIILSTELLGDGLIVFWSLLTIYLIIAAGDSSGGLRKTVLFYAGGLSIGITYLVKDPYLMLILPAFMLTYILQKYHNKDIKLKHYMLLAAGILTIIAVETLVNYSLTGYPFFRIYPGQDAKATFIAWNPYMHSGIKGLLYVTMILMPKWLLWPLDGTNVFFGFFFAAGLAGSILFMIRKAKAGFPFILWSVLAYFGIWWGIWIVFRIVCEQQPRYLAPLAVPLSVAGGFFVAELKSKTVKRIVLGIIMSYGLLCIIILGIDRMYGRVPLNAMMDAIHKYPGYTIVTDARTKGKLEFLTGYKTPEIFVSFEDSNFTLPSKSVIIIDETMAEFKRRNYNYDILANVRDTINALPVTNSVEIPERQGIKQMLRGTRPEKGHKRVLFYVITKTS